MTFKDMFAKTRNFLMPNSAGRGFRPSVDSQGLINDESGSGVGAVETEGQDIPGRTELVRQGDKPVSLDRKESIEVLGAAFNRMVDQLEGINEHLGKQIAQHEKLMDRIDELPELLENLPNAIDNQKQLVNSLAEQLKSKTLKEQQFVQIVEKIPAKIAKQTDVIGDMNNKLSVSADADVQMAESLNKFNETLSKLDSDTVSQTEGIAQMSKTFAASDRYLKYIISRQHKRFMWVFITAMSVCAIAIFALVAAIVVAMNR